MIDTRQSPDGGVEVLAHFRLAVVHCPAGQLPFIAGAAGEVYDAGAGECELRPGRGPDLRRAGAVRAAAAVGSGTFRHGDSLADAGRGTSPELDGAPADGSAAHRGGTHGGPANAATHSDTGAADRSAGRDRSAAR